LCNKPLHFNNDTAKNLNGTNNNNNNINRKTGSQIE